MNENHEGAATSTPDFTKFAKELEQLSELNGPLTDEHRRFLRSMAQLAVSPLTHATEVVAIVQSQMDLMAKCSEDQRQAIVDAAAIRAKIEAGYQQRENDLVVREKTWTQELNRAHVDLVCEKNKNERVAYELEQAKANIARADHILRIYAEAANSLASYDQRKAATTIAEPAA